MDALSAGRTRLEAKTYTSKMLANLGLTINQDGSRRTGFQLLAFPDVTFSNLLELDPELSDIDAETRIQLERDALYANYIDRQQRDVDAMRRDEMQIIPESFHFEGIEGLSNELKLKLGRSRPANLLQASKIDGMTPAALTLILAKLRQSRREKAS